MSVSMAFHCTSTEGTTFFSAESLACPPPTLCKVLKPGPSFLLCFFHLPPSLPHLILFFSFSTSPPVHQSPTFSQLLTTFHNQVLSAPLTLSCSFFFLCQLLCPRIFSVMFFSVCRTMSVHFPRQCCTPKASHRHPNRNQSFSSLPQLALFFSSIF